VALYLLVEPLQAIGGTDSPPVALGERKARQALLYVLLEVFGHLFVAPAPPIGQLLGGPQSSSSLVGAENTARRPAPSSLRFAKETSPRRFFA
jgi:hypothetical protein